MYVAAFGFSKNYGEIMAGQYGKDVFAGTNQQAPIRILKKAMAKFVCDSPGILWLELSAKKILGSRLDDFIQAAPDWEVEEAGYAPTEAERKLVNLISANLKDG